VTQRDNAEAAAVRVVIDVPDDLYRKLAAEAEERGVPVNQLMSDLARGWFLAHHPR
jgi:hypothetical protein